MEVKKVSKKGFSLLKLTVLEFIEDNGMKLSASLSYYTIFSLPPLMIIIISVAGMFFGKDAVTGEFFGQINGLVGNAAALQIQEAIKNVELSGNNTFATTIGIIMLLVGASGVFAEIQSSINFIWGLKARPNRGLMKFIRNRLMSFSMIASVGFLLLVSLMMNTLMDVMNKRLLLYFPEMTFYVFYVLNMIVVFLIITSLFSIIFKSLPDGEIRWKDSLIGAGFTSIFFMLGKFAIGAYLGSSTIASVYGAAGSVIVILIWVYYSAIILYFGAEFTKVYAREYGDEIVPNPYSVKIFKQEVEL
ncbi:YihY/virulence factor BrkB family protein [Flavobacterium sp. '19STA2R22 D10 B1']|uniref:YihY/virulence factor BrkB family protein n=1 Tax=Flavobacterium aerium TaxID=3037261 RepID=UPI00278C5AAB|nr:YihY/virulence factor BrkB family protein [Flavobacterium sp. '19STA2R22 D10 B1']